MPVAKMTPLKEIKAVQNWSLQFAMMAAFLSAIGLYSPLINMVNQVSASAKELPQGRLDYPESGSNPPYKPSGYSNPHGGSSLALTET